MTNATTERVASVLAEIAQARAIGLSEPQIVSDIGLKPTTIVRYLEKAGRSDLAVPFRYLGGVGMTGSCLDCGIAIERRARRCTTCYLTHRRGLS